jgi:hypothetical protein
MLYLENTIPEVDLPRRLATPYAIRGFRGQDSSATGSISTGLHD